MPKIAYFISSHGFGHATRSLAVMLALRDRMANTEFEIFTKAPSHLFSHLNTRYRIHEVVGDVGIIQPDPFSVNINATIKELKRLFPFSSDLVAHCAFNLKSCDLVICDISPLGIEAARQAMRPVALIGNFTWDWIYSAFREADKRFDEFIPVLYSIYEKADLIIQTEPICHEISRALTVAPVSCMPRRSHEEIREDLELPRDRKILLVSMGGFPVPYQFLREVSRQQDLFLLVMNASGMMERHENYLLMPQSTEYFHPDLMNCCDAVICKAGYSTIAEAFHLGLPIGFIRHPHSPESASLASFVDTYMPNLEIFLDELVFGQWLNKAAKLINMDRLEGERKNGASQVADILIDTIFSSIIQ